MGGAVKSKETREYEKAGTHANGNGCGYQSCRTVTCSGARSRISLPVAEER
jgi:hypothetical protein